MPQLSPWPPSPSGISLHSPHPGMVQCWPVSPGHRGSSGPTPQNLGWTRKPQAEAYGLEQPCKLHAKQCVTLIVPSSRAGELGSRGLMQANHTLPPWGTGKSLPTPCETDASVPCEPPSITFPQGCPWHHAGLGTGGGIKSSILQVFADYPRCAKS